MKKAIFHRPKPPAIAPHPGKVLDRWLVMHGGVTQQEAADAIGISRLTINEIILGKRAITAETAIRLGMWTGVPARDWLSLQMEYDLLHPPQSPNIKPRPKIKRFNWPV